MTSVFCVVISYHYSNREQTGLRPERPNSDIPRQRCAPPDITVSIFALFKQIKRIKIPCEYFPFHKRKPGRQWSSLGWVSLFATTLGSLKLTSAPMLMLPNYEIYQQILTAVMAITFFGSVNKNLFFRRKIQTNKNAMCWLFVHKIKLTIALKGYPLKDYPHSNHHQS